MKLLTIKTMALPEPPKTTDWTFLGVIWGICGTIVTVMFKWIDSAFAARKLEREAFIKAVVAEAMKEGIAEMRAKINDMKDDVNTLFKYRDEDKRHLDNRLDAILREVKK